MITYRKVRFTSKRNGNTAGIVLDDSYFPALIPAISRLFPYSEANKMERFQQSPAFATWN